MEQTDSTSNSGDELHVTPPSAPHAPEAAIAMGVAAGFLFCGYEFIRTTSNTLFKEAAPAGYGKEGLPYIIGLVPFAVLLAVYGYGKLLTRLGPRKTLLATSLLSGLAMAACYIAIRCGFRPARGALYLVREAYVVLLVEQYWSFLNSSLGTTQAKNWNGPICGLGSAGAILGAMVVSNYSSYFGSVNLLVFAAVSVIPAAVLANIAYRRCGEPRETPAEAARHVDTLGLSLFKANPMLILLLLVIFATQTLASVLDLSFQARLQDAIPNLDAQNSYQGDFWFHVNVAAALGQFIFSPLLLRLLPLTVVHVLMPAINLGICAYAWRQPSLASAWWALLAFKTMDYSVFRAGKEILYIPFSYDVRYRAKEVIDVWGYRFSKGSTGWLLAAMKFGGFAITDATYSALACGAGTLWLIVIMPVCRMYEQHVAKGESGNIE